MEGWKGSADGKPRRGEKADLVDFGGDDEAELRESRRKGLLAWLDGLVLLGLGPLVMLPLSGSCMGDGPRDKADGRG